MVLLLNCVFLLIPHELYLGFVPRVYNQGLKYQGFTLFSFSSFRFSFSCYNKKGIKSKYSTERFIYPPMNDTAMENSNREQRKNAGIVHPKRGEVPLDSAPASAAKEGRADANDDDDDEKKKRREVSTGGRRRQQQQQPRLYFGILKEHDVAWIIVIFALVRLCTRYWFRPSTFITCTEEQPLVKIEENFLNFLEYEKLRKCTMEHPRLHIPSALSTGAFSKTRGFVVKFNKEGVDSFLNHPDYGDCFGDLFNKMRLPETNAYVFNALLCELSDYDEWRNNKTTVGLHLDQTVGLEGLQSNHQFLAHQVNVLYVDVAPDMKGGELEGWRYMKGDLKVSDLPNPHMTIKPEKNKLVMFRGDTFHQVKAYHTAHSTTKRLSLVLEQYKISDEYFPNTVTWMEALKQNMTMM